MEIKLGKMQKLILVCIGVNTKEQLYIKRRELTDGIFKLFDYEKNTNLSKKISRSIGLLSRRGLISRKGSYIGLTDDGKDITRNVIEHIKSEYDGKIDWEIISKYYYRKQKDSLRYAKGSIEIINKLWDTHESFCSNLKKFNIKKGDRICVIYTPLYKKDVEPTKLDVKVESVECNETTKKQTKSRKTKQSSILINGLGVELATEENFKAYKTLLKIFPEVLPKVEERKQELFKHYDSVREQYPNYPPLMENEWKAYPKEWKKLDDECNKLMKVQKNKEAFSNYLFEISCNKFPHIDEKIIRFAISEYQKESKKSKSLHL